MSSENKISFFAEWISLEWKPFNQLDIDKI